MHKAKKIYSTVKINCFFSTGCLEILLLQGSGISKGIIFLGERQGVGINQFCAFSGTAQCNFIVTWKGVLQTSQQDLAITLLHHHPCGLYPKIINICQCLQFKILLCGENKTIVMLNIDIDHHTITPAEVDDLLDKTDLNQNGDLEVEYASALLRYQFHSNPKEQFKNY